MSMTHFFSLVAVRNNRNVCGPVGRMAGAENDHKTHLEATGVAPESGRL